MPKIKKPRARPTHCLRNHEYTEQNTFIQLHANGREMWSCKKCRNEYASGWRKTEKGQLVAERRRAKKYGLTVEELREMETNGCHLCGSTDTGSNLKLHVDHSHETGAVRGILCHGCNTALGLFKDDPALLRAAAEYLERSVA